MPVSFHILCLDITLPVIIRCPEQSITSLQFFVFVNIAMFRQYAPSHNPSLQHIGIMLKVRQHLWVNGNYSAKAIHCMDIQHVVNIAIYNVGKKIREISNLVMYLHNSFEK